MAQTALWCEIGGLPRVSLFVLSHCKNARRLCEAIEAAGAEADGRSEADGRITGPRSRIRTHHRHSLDGSIQATPLDLLGPDVVRLSGLVWFVAAASRAVLDTKSACSRKSRDGSHCDTR